VLSVAGVVVVMVVVLLVVLVLGRTDRTLVQGGGLLGRDDTAERSASDEDEGEGENSAHGFPGGVPSMMGPAGPLRKVVAGVN
jgi:hypothetical protein